VPAVVENALPTTGEFAESDVTGFASASLWMMPFGSASWLSTPPLSSPPNAQPCVPGVRVSMSPSKSAERIDFPEAITRP
jgi:hypothetical protein